MDYIDSGFINALRGTPIPDLLGEFSKGYAVTNKIFDDKRQRDIEDYKIALQERQYADQMAEQARRNKLEEMLMPYKVQEIQARIAKLKGIGGTDGAPAAGSAFDIVNAIRQKYSAPAPEVEISNAQMAPAAPPQTPVAANPFAGQYNFGYQ